MRKLCITECSMAADCLTRIDEQCTSICDTCTENLVLRERCNCRPAIESCMTVTATHTVSYAPPVVTITPTCPPLLVAQTYSPSVETVTPSCSTTTMIYTEYLSITPTNCLQSTHSKETSTTVGTGYTDTVTRGDSNSSLNTATGGATCNGNLVILGAFIAVLAALLVAVTTGWIVTCVVNRRKDKASTR